MIIGTPSYMMNIIDEFERQGLDPAQSSLKRGMFGAEPWGEGMRRELEQRLGIDATNLYGLSEVMGPGVAAECIESKDGPVVWEDHFYPEIIDPQTGEVLPDGQEGELVLTTLSKQAMPMLRYRTRDITSLDTKPCECGRTIRRITRIGRRSDDMFIIRGVNVFPSQVETALMAVEETLPHYQIVLLREKGLDQMEVQVEVTSGVFSDKVRALEDLHAKLSHALETILGIRVGVRLVEPQTIERSQGKAKRVVDKRNEGKV
jgi:phenylacetate-CoA ligase